MCRAHQLAPRDQARSTWWPTTPLPELASLPLEDALQLVRLGRGDLVTTARTYTHVVADEAELDYAAVLT